MTFEPTEPQDGVDPNMFTLIDPDDIPYPLSDVWSLNYAAETLRTGGEDLFGGAEDMRSTWQGLQAHYEAPESETLFTKMDPVVTKGEDIESDLATVAGALEDLAEAAKTARRSLNTLRIEAQGFWNRHHDEKVWWLTEDEKTDEWALIENIRLKDAVNTAWSTFNEAENDCASRISAVFDGPAYASPGQAGGDDVLIYGLPTDAGERDLSMETALSFEGVNSFANDAAAWAGSEFHPSLMDFESGWGQALWDVVVTDTLWGAAVGLTTKLGYWHPDNGWRVDPSGRWDNTKAAWDDARMDASALIGIHDDQGWLWETPEEGLSEGESTWDRWTDNLEASKDELVEGHTAWSTREDGTSYSNTTMGANAVMMTGGLPLKLVKAVLGTGVGGSSGGSSSGSDGSDGSDSDGSDQSTSQGGPGTGNWPSRPLSQRPEDGTSTSERFENPLTTLRESLLDPHRFRETPSPSPRPDTPSPAPDRPVPTGGGDPKPDDPTPPQRGDTSQSQDGGRPPHRPGDEDDRTEPRPAGDDADAPRGLEEKPGAPAATPRPESEVQSGDFEGSEAPTNGERSEQPSHTQEDGDSPRQGEDKEGQDDHDGERREPGEEQPVPEPDAEGGGGQGGGDEPPKTDSGDDGDDRREGEDDDSDDSEPEDPREPNKPAPPERVINDLRDFDSRKMTYGDSSFVLDRSGMKHILVRHHPDYWNGSKKGDQSFFDRRMGIEEIADATEEVMKQNRDEIIRRGSNDTYQVSGQVDGEVYRLGLRNGRVGQFFPVY